MTKSTTDRLATSVSEGADFNAMTFHLIVHVKVTACVYDISICIFIHVNNSGHIYM